MRYTKKAVAFKKIRVGTKGIGAGDELKPNMEVTKVKTQQTRVQ